MNKAFIQNLVANKKELIELKKAQKKYTNGSNTMVLSSSKTTSKGLYSNTEDKLERTIIGNTYLWLDNHDDVHAKNCFAKSINERQDKIFHLHDHEFKITAKVGEPQKIYEESIAWKELNIEKEGNTQALHMDSEVLKSYNPQIFGEYKNDNVDQHSVGMQYVKLDLAVNDEDYEDEYKVWLEFIDQIGNPEKAEEKGYFWVVREAKLIEISAVLLGSNELTPTLSNKIEADIVSLQKKEAEKSLQNKRNYFMNLN